MRTVQSAHLQAVDYDTQTESLVVQFVNGAVYRYPGVRFSDYHTLLQSSSPGAYFHAKIKPNYPAQKIADAPKRRR